MRTYTTSCLQLHTASRRGPVVTRPPTIAEYLAYWLAEVVKPNREPNTYSQYELFSRRYIIPGIGNKRVDRLTVREVQRGLTSCPVSASAVLRARMLTAVRTNVAAVSREMLRGLSEQAHDQDRPRHSPGRAHAGMAGRACLAQRCPDGHAARCPQVQRVGRQLIHKHQLKSDGSTDVLPLPGICLSALKIQRRAQDRMRARIAEQGGTWPDDGLVSTTRTGRPIEPRAVKRRFDARCAEAGVRRIRVHDTRRTCGSLLAALTCIPALPCRSCGTKIAITMEIYTEIPSASTREALRKLGQWLDDAPGA